MRIEFAKRYAYAHLGHLVVRYEAGQVVEDAPDYLVEAATSAGVLKTEDPKKKARKK